MGQLSNIVKQLKKERDRAEQELFRLNAALSAFVGAYRGNKAKPTRKRGKMLAKARAKSRSRAEGEVGKGESEEESGVDHLNS